MKRTLLALLMVWMPLAEAGISDSQQAQMEAACTRWADREELSDEATRGAFISACLEGLEHELSETGALELD